MLLNRLYSFTHSYLSFLNSSIEIPFYNFAEDCNGESGVFVVDPGSYE